MKKLIVICWDHLDSVWLRGFEKQFFYGQCLIRPYADVEEFLFDRWMDIVENSDCIYGIEASFSVKKYIDRNPDKKERFARLLKEGKIELQGGGETLIDSNLVDGESIVRNQMYSILWYQENFNARPGHATLHDTFGMSCQLPQILRKVGYKAIVGFAYSGINKKPFWKGLNGDMIYFAPDYKVFGYDMIYASKGSKIPVCPKCLGQGCRICNRTGLDYSHARAKTNVENERRIKEFLVSEQETLVYYVGSEEIAEREDFPAFIKEMADKYGLMVEYTSDFRLIQTRAGSKIDALVANRVDPVDIDERMDWNPACTGVYVTRIEMKKTVRKLENLLLACEKFASLAVGYGMIYPAKKIEGLWSSMALLQFHDSITSTMSDGAYVEMMDISRKIGQGAMLIYTEAMKILEKSISVPEKTGYVPFILFNPLGWEVHATIVEASFILPQSHDLHDLAPENAEITDNLGIAHEIVTINAIDNQHDTSLLVGFRVDSLPSLGYKVFYLKLSRPGAFGIPNPKTGVPGQALTIGNERSIGNTRSIDNEYYRIDVRGNEMIGIWDKKINEYVLGHEANDITIEDDIGSPWETLVKPIFKERLCNPYYIDNIVPSDYQIRTTYIDNIVPTDCQVRTTIEESPAVKVLIREGTYRKPERKIRQVVWRQEIRLYKGVDRVDFKTEIDWDAGNNRIRIAFPLTFRPESDEAWYEIPYGLLKRTSYQPTTGGYTSRNGDWPALNFTACHNKVGDYTVAILNKGIPSYSVKDGVIYLSVLRSPEEFFCGFNIEGARDSGKHVFEYALVSGKGGIKENNVARLGREFNTEYMNCKATVKTALLPSANSFIKNSNGNIVISSIKRAEKSDNLVIRAYEAYGETASDNLTLNGAKVGGKLHECDLLEEETGAIAGSEVNFRPYEIKTIMVDIHVKG